MATRTRQEYLKDLVMNYSTSTPLDTGQKFSIFGSKKKDKPRPRFIPDLCQRGAILWQVLLDDSGQGRQVECFLGISSDTFVLIEEHSRQIVFVTPCKSILGWSPQTNSLRVYHHQGECMTIHMRDWHVDRDELMEIMDRLKAVTGGHVAQEFTIRLSKCNFLMQGTLTSSSSGQSGDDKWYDRLQELDPPPVPVKSQHASRNVHANNTFPSTPKRNNSYHVSQIQSNHGLRQDAEYTSPTRGYNTIAADLSRFNIGDGHSSDSSLGDRLNLVGSEDELIAGGGVINGGGSPRMGRRPAKQLNATPQTAAYYGRNQSSPRSMNGGAAGAEAKLRPGVASRSSNRNSANLSTNFQEELMRLINPDNIEPEQQRSVKEIKTHSRENLNNGLSLHKTQSDMLLGMSRSTSSSASPLHSDFKRSQDDVKLGITFPEDFPLPEDSDWPSLVDTATSFMNQVESTVEHTTESDPRSVPELQNHVAELESKVDRETRRRMSLENEVRRLTEENRKLQDQAHAAATQLRRFTEWFFKNVKRQ
nr:unnamed protein product [Callosobruchus analis]